MKHSIFIILFVLASTLFIASCSKMSGNGDLDGKWLLTERVYKTPYEINCVPSAVYWSFQLDLLSITSPDTIIPPDVLAPTNIPMAATSKITSPDTINTKTTETLCRFVKGADKLNITQTYIHYRDRDSLLTASDTKALISVGIRSNVAQFRIARLNSSSLILVSQDDSLVFKKLN